MSFKADFSTTRQRLSELQARFQKTTGSRAGDAAGAAQPHGSAWQNLRALFTEGVTRDGLSSLFRREARDTFRFFTRQIDFASLAHLPWYKRYWHAAWKVFTAMAYRLSPPRRILFAIAAFSLLLGFLNSRLQVNSHGTRFHTQSDSAWWLLSAGLFALLLLMELKDKLDLKRDLEIAREIQFGLVPVTPFRQGLFSIHCSMRPANTIGGDYYDIIELGENRIAVVVGDVAGKGMPAALLMALLQGSVHTLITAGLRGAELVSKLNAYLCKSIPAGSLVTLCYGELDTGTGEFLYVNAGHNPPFAMSRQQPPRRLTPTSIVLGVLERDSFESRREHLAPGEALLLFTDGVTEASNAMEQEYGEARLEQLLRNHRRPYESDLIQHIIADVLAFCGEDASPNDDMTLMLIQRAE